MTTVPAPPDEYLAGRIADLEHRIQGNVEARGIVKTVKQGCGRLLRARPEPSRMRPAVTAARESPSMPRSRPCPKPA